MPAYRFDEEGILEKLCTRCHEWWPVTLEPEYYRWHTRGYAFPWCRACEAEQKTEQKAEKTRKEV